MTATTTEDFEARLVALLDEVRAVRATPRAPVNPDGTPGNVVTGELIESAWGNAVANNIGTLTSTNNTQNSTLATHAAQLTEMRQALVSLMPGTNVGPTADTDPHNPITFPLSRSGLMMVMAVIPLNCTGSPVMVDTTLYLDSTLIRRYRDVLGTDEARSVTIADVRYASAGQTVYIQVQKISGGTYQVYAGDSTMNQATIIQGLYGTYSGLLSADGQQLQEEEEP